MNGHFREIIGIKWKNNMIENLKLKDCILGEIITEIFMTLKELHDEALLLQSQDREIPSLTLKYHQQESGGSVAKWVYVAKIGDQYEIRDVKDNVIPNAILEMEKIQ